jgi:protein O-GlcNAc transferase
LSLSQADAHSNLGNLLKAQGLSHHAYYCYLEALRIQPTFAIAWSNLAGICMEWGDLQRALAYYQEAVRLKPKFADAHCNMGNVLKVGHCIGLWCLHHGVRSE